jgi:hypothetical protein
MIGEIMGHAGPHPAAISKPKTNAGIYYADVRAGTIAKRVGIPPGSSRRALRH